MNMHSNVMGWQRYWAVWLYLVIGIVNLAASEAASAQSAERSLRVWVDTVDLNVCEGRAFDSLGVWLESFTWNEELEKADPYIGFRTQDSVLACTITLQWDTSTIRLQPPYILVPPQTLFGRFATKVQSVDTAKGTLYVSVAANENLKIVVGKGIPLFYLTGSIRAVDTVDLPNGGARTQYLDIEGTLGDNVGTVDFQPGFVRVIRDTTPEYTGTLRVSEGMLDTNRHDTIFVIAGNLSNKRVTELRFALRADTSKFQFIGTVDTGMSASPGSWRSKDIALSADSISIELIADAAITDRDSVVLGIILERTTDSGFTTALQVSEFSVNALSCLGNLKSYSGTVAALKISAQDTTTTSVQREDLENSGTEIVVVQLPGSVRVVFQNIRAEEARLYDIAGRVVETWRGEELRNGMEIVEAGAIPSGTYFLTVRGHDERIWYKQIVIQTN